MLDFTMFVCHVYLASQRFGQEMFVVILNPLPPKPSWDQTQLKCDWGRETFQIRPQSGLENVFLFLPMCTQAFRQDHVFADASWIIHWIYEYWARQVNILRPICICGLFPLNQRETCGAHCVASFLDFCSCFLYVIFQYCHIMAVTSSDYVHSSWVRHIAVNISDP